MEQKSKVTIPNKIYDIDITMPSIMMCTDCYYTTSCIVNFTVCLLKCKFRVYMLVNIYSLFKFTIDVLTP